MVDFSIQGFAKADGVTGGQGGASIVVTNTNEYGAGSLDAAITTSGPRVITFTPGLTGTITFANLHYVNSSNMTIDGAGANITLSGMSLNLHTTTNGAVENIIMKNLIIANTTGNRNAINIEYGTKRVWIDHITFHTNSTIPAETGQGIAIWSRGVQTGFTGITVSWCNFYDNHKGILIGEQNDATSVPMRVTVHHCWFNHVDGRNPRIHGLDVTVHCYNNYNQAWVEYGIGGSNGCNVLSEGNIFENVNPTNGFIYGLVPDYGMPNPGYEWSQTCTDTGVSWAYAVPANYPLPTIRQTVAQFDKTKITYSNYLSTANAQLRSDIMQYSGANKTAPPPVEHVVTAANVVQINKVSTGALPGSSAIGISITSLDYAFNTGFFSCTIKNASTSTISAGTSIDVLYYSDTVLQESENVQIGPIIPGASYAIPYTGAAVFLNPGQHDLVAIINLGANSLIELTGADVLQANKVTTGIIYQTHVLSGLNCIQQNVVTTDGVTLPLTVVITITNLDYIFDTGKFVCTIKNTGNAVIDAGTAIDVFYYADTFLQESETVVIGPIAPNSSYSIPYTGAIVFLNPGQHDLAAIINLGINTIVLSGSNVRQINRCSTGVVVPDTWNNKQPGIEAQIEWFNPITAGLVLCAHPIGSSFTDVANGLVSVWGGNSKPAPRSQYGTLGFEFNEGYFDFSTTYLNGADKEVSCFVLASVTNDTADNFQPVSVIGNSLEWNLNSFSGGTWQAILYDSATGALNTLGYHPDFNILQSNTFTRDGANHYTSYWQATPEASGTDLTANYPVSPDVKIGGYLGLWFKGIVFLELFYNRILSAAEVASLNANPWQVFTKSIKTVEVSGEDVLQINYSTTGPVIQTVALSGDNVQQINRCTTGAIESDLTHFVTAANVLQNNKVSSGSVIADGTHYATADNVFQINKATTGIVYQTHVLSGANCTQANKITTGSIVQTNDLAADNVKQINSITNAEVQQTHAVQGGDALQKNYSSTGNIIQIHALTGANVRQVNKVSTGMVVETGSLQAANVIQINRCSTGAVDADQTHYLTARKTIQRNRVSTGRIGRFEEYHCTGLLSDTPMLEMRNVC